MGPEAHPAVARILVAGTELLGDKRDLNGPDLARRLAQRGIRVESITILGDDRALLAGEIGRAIREPGLLVTCGGLGPTADDVTRDAACDALGCALREDAPSRRRIDELYARRGRAPGELSLRQALLPEPAEAVPNPTGLAVGAIVPLPRGVLVMLPGPPGELAAMADEALDRAVALLAGRGMAPGPVPRSAVLVLAGIGESDAAAAVTGLPGIGGAGLAWLARPGEVRLILSHEQDERLREAVAAARSALGAAVVSCDGRGVAEVVLAILSGREETLAVAESCTGGLVAAEITSVPGSSSVFRRGFVTYADDAKTDVLGVPPHLLQDHGAVSEEVARAMALGARRSGRADWGIGITGIAGPGGGTDAKPVGLVHWAVARADGRVEAWRSIFTGSRDDIRRRAAAAALDSVRRCL